MMQHALLPWCQQGSRRQDQESCTAGKLFCKSDIAMHVVTAQLLLHKRSTKC